MKETDKKQVQEIKKSIKQKNQIKKQTKKNIYKSTISNKSK